jgi:oxalate decarboxylase/phosphoglucose isomerase-like protein (cupin superfamily)
MVLILQAEWGYLYSGEVLLSAVDEHGNYQVEKLEVGDVWYFPKGSAHTIQGRND